MVCLELILLLQTHAIKFEYIIVNLQYLKFFKFCYRAWNRTKLIIILSLKTAYCIQKIVLVTCFLFSLYRAIWKNLDTLLSMSYNCEKRIFSCAKCLLVDLNFSILCLICIIYNWRKRNWIYWTLFDVIYLHSIFSMNGYFYSLFK